MYEQNNRANNNPGHLPALLAHILKLAIWNINGLCQRSKLPQADMSMRLKHCYDINIMLISKKCFTNNSYINIEKYSFMSQITLKVRLMWALH